MQSCDRADAIRSIVSGNGMDLSRYRKILVYALTFLAYAWSGYGSGLLSNLRDAVLAAETVFHGLFENAITVARKIKDIHEVFDAAVEENCVFQCPDGNARLQPINACTINVRRIIRLSRSAAQLSPPLVDHRESGSRSFILIALSTHSPLRLLESGCAALLC